VLNSQNNTKENYRGYSMHWTQDLYAKQALHHRANRWLENNI